MAGVAEVEEAVEAAAEGGEGETCGRRGHGWECNVRAWRAARLSRHSEASRRLKPVLGLFVRRRPPGVPGGAPAHASDWRVRPTGEEAGGTPAPQRQWSDWRVRAHRGGRRANTRFA